MAAKVYASSQIRNVAIVGHGGCGKTSLAEALLFLSGANKRLGKVDDQTSCLDFEPEEQRRRSSVASSLAWLEHDGTKINLLDTPGDQNFIFDSFNAMRGVDGAVVVVSAPDGVEVQTEAVYHQATELGLPRLFFISKMDRERANPSACLDDIKDSFGVTPVPIQVPIGTEHDFEGVIDLFRKKAYIFNKDGSGKYEAKDIPAELSDDVELSWEQLVECVAETDDVLIEKYLDTGELNEEEIKEGFRNGIRAGTLCPVLFGAGTSCIGASRLLDVISWGFPSPLERSSITCEVGGEESSLDITEKGPFVAQVIHTNIDEQSGKLSIFRVLSGTVPSDGLVSNTSAGQHERLGSMFTLSGKERQGQNTVPCGDIAAVPKLKYTHTGDTLAGPKSTTVLPKVGYPPPMMSYVIQPAGKGDEDKLKTGLERLLEEDPTLTVTHDPLTKQLVLNGMGQAHLDMAIERMKRKYKVNATSSLPPVPYRETLRKPAQHIEGKHKKQTGGAGQFGVCYINVLPQPRDDGFDFVDKIKGGSIPNQFIPSVEKGIKKCMEHGFLGGYPIVDIKIELVDGKYHPVDSKDVAFQLAGSKG
ncbi:MAG: elongation factor G, partial [Myxococcota bacterium]|nr:elongation factor G [Myxococcota bacterium]